MSILEPEVQPIGEEELVNKLGDVMNAHRFMQWLNKSGVLDQVRRRSNVYTIIIPIDEAIERLPENVVELLDTTPSDLKNLLEYHVIPKDVNIKQLKDGEILSSLNDKPILFNIYNRGLQTLSGSPIIKDIYQSMEEIADKCQTVANNFETIIMKNS